MRQNLSTFLLYGVPIVLFLILTIGFGFNGLYGQDSHTYLKCSFQLREWMKYGDPIQHYYWPYGYPISGLLISLIGIPIKVSLLLISLFSLIGVLYFSNKIISKLFMQSGSWWLIIGAATSVYFVRGGLVIMSDMLAAFFIIGAYYHYFLLIKEAKKQSAFLFIIFALLSIITRYPSIFLIVIPFFHILLNLVKNQSRILLFTIFLSAIAALVGMLTINNEMLERGLMMANQWNIVNFFENSFYNDTVYLEFKFPNFIQVFTSSLHPGYLSVALLLIPFIRNIGSINLIMITSLLIYYLFLAGLEIQNYRFFIMSHLLVLICLFPSFQGLADWLKSKRIFNSFLVTTLIINCSIFIYSFSKTFDAHLIEKEICGGHQINEFRRQDL